MWKSYKLRLWLLACLALLLIFTVSGCGSKPAIVENQATKEFDITVYKNNDFLITPQKLQAMLGSDNLVLIDCNKPDIYTKEHIPGAIGVGLSGFCDNVGKPGDPGWGTIKKKEDLQKTLESLGIDNKKTIVFYSDLSVGSGSDGRAVWQLKLAGMDNVKMLVGGNTLWKELGYEMTQDVAQPKPVTGLVLKDYDQSYMASKEFIYEKLGKQVLIDCRTEGEYKGSQKVGEPRGGHIAGAVFLEWKDLLNKDAGYTIKSPDEIKTLMASYGVHPEDDFTIY